MGQWTLSPPYSHIEQNSDKWFGSMFQLEKQDVITTLNAGTSETTKANKTPDGERVYCLLKFACLYLTLP